MWGLSPSDNNAAINAYKTQYGVTNPCAGTQGGGPQAIDVTTTGQPFLGYPTYVVVCPDKSVFFDVCWPPPNPECFDQYIINCGFSPLSANFESDQNKVCPGETVNYTDLSVGTITSWAWTFEGGNPANSSQQNPSVVYETPGSYDVTLTVSDGTNTNTKTVENYIETFTNPVVTLQPFNSVCSADPPFELTGGSPAGGVYSGTGVTEGWFYPAVAGIGTHTITYEYTDVNECSGIAHEDIIVTPCTGLNEQDNQKMSIYPNPVTSEFTLSLTAKGTVIITISSLQGSVVYELEFAADGKVFKTVPMLNLKDGIYIVTVKTPDRNYYRKLNLSRK